MATSYLDPYTDNQRRTGGPQRNGTQGSQTIQSIQNAGQQSKGTGNPYDAFGNLSAAWTNALTGYMQSRAENPVDDPPAPPGQTGTFPPPPPPTQTPPPTPGSNTGWRDNPSVITPPPDPGGKRRSGGLPGTGGDPANGVPPPVDPPQPQSPPPSQQQAVESTYGVSFAEIERMGGNADQYGTFMRWIGDGMSKYGTEAMRPYVEHIRRAPGIISSYHEDMNQAARNGVTGIHFVDWLGHQFGGFTSPLAGQMGEGSAAAAKRWADIKQGNYGGPPSRPLPTRTTQPRTTPPAPPQQPPPTNPATPPPAQPGTGGQPPAPTTPPATAPQPTVPLTLDPSMLSPEVDLSYLDPVYQDALEKVREQMMHAGSITGAIDSGGFGQSLSEGMAPLANQFAAQKGQLYYQAQQANADRILDRYKFDNTQDLEKFLAQNKNDLERYGIDQNVLLQRWLQENRAQLEREGFDVQKWIAEMQGKYGLEGARIQADAAGAAAAASSSAAKYNADLDYQLGMSRLGYDFWNSKQGYTYDDIFNKRNYDLGVLGINRDIYGMDQAQWRYLIDSMYRQSPDARLSMVNLPGMMPY